MATAAKQRRYLRIFQRGVFPDLVDSNAPYLAKRTHLPAAADGLRIKVQLLGNVVDNGMGQQVLLIHRLPPSRLPPVHIVGS